MEINTYFLNYAVPAHTKTRKITGLLAKWRGVCLVNLLWESTKAERFLSQRFNNPALKARRFPFGPKISIDIFFSLTKNSISAAVGCTIPRNLLFSPRNFSFSSAVSLQVLKSWLLGDFIARDVTLSFVRNCTVKLTTKQRKWPNASLCLLRGNITRFCLTEIIMVKRQWFLF